MGWIDQAFIKEVETSTASLEKPRVLVTDLKISMMSEILPILEGIVNSEEQSPLLIFCLDLTGEAKSGLQLNKTRGVVDVCVVRAPGFGALRTHYLEDICAFTGATFITSQLQKKLQ